RFAALERSADLRVAWPKLPRASSTLPANERTTPRATFRRGQLSLQSNEIFGRTNPIPKRSRRRANCAQAFVAGPAVLPLYFQRAPLAEVPAAGRRHNVLQDSLFARSFPRYHCGSMSK